MPNPTMNPELQRFRDVTGELPEIASSLADDIHAFADRMHAADFPAADALAAGNAATQLRRLLSEARQVVNHLAAVAEEHGVDAPEDDHLIALGNAARNDETLTAEEARAELAKDDLGAWQYAILVHKRAFSRIRQHRPVAPDGIATIDLDTAFSMFIFPGGVTDEEASASFVHTAPSASLKDNLTDPTRRAYPDMEGVQTYTTAQASNAANTSGFLAQSGADTAAIPDGVFLDGSAAAASDHPDQIPAVSLPAEGPAPASDPAPLDTLVQVPDEPRAPLPTPQEPSQPLQAQPDPA